MATIAGREIDEARAANAETINSAYGAGAADALLMVGNWSDNREGYEQAIELLANPRLVAWYAERRGEFAGLAAQTDLYRAGWDVGFGATLLSGAADIRAKRPTGWY